MSNIAFIAGMERQKGESMPEWCNRLRELRGNAPDLVWIRVPGGDMRLVPRYKPESMFDRQQNIDF